MKRFLLAVVIAVGLSLPTPAEAVVVQRVIYTYQSQATGARTIITLQIDGVKVTACREYYIRNLGALNCEVYDFTRPGDSSRFSWQLQTWVWESTRS